MHRHRLTRPSDSTELNRLVYVQTLHCRHSGATTDARLHLPQLMCASRSPGAQRTVWPSPRRVRSHIWSPHWAGNRQWRRCEPHAPDRRSEASQRRVPIPVQQRNQRRDHVGTGSHPGADRPHIRDHQPRLSPHPTALAYGSPHPSYGQRLAYIKPTNSPITPQREPACTAHAPRNTHRQPAARRMKFLYIYIYK